MALRADETPYAVTETPLVVPKGVADVGDMGDGAFEERGARRAAAARSKAGARTRRPSRLRVVATLSADIVAFLTASLLTAIGAAMYVNSVLMNQPCMFVARIPIWPRSTLMGTSAS